MLDSKNLRLVLNICDSRNWVWALETFAMCLWSLGSEVYVAKAEAKRAERAGKPLKYKNCSEVGHRSTGPTFETIKSVCLILNAGSSFCLCTLWWECQIARARVVSTGISLLEKNKQTNKCSCRHLSLILCLKGLKQRLITGCSCTVMVTTLLPFPLCQLIILPC